MQKKDFELWDPPPLYQKLPKKDFEYRNTIEKYPNLLDVREKFVC